MGSSDTPMTRYTTSDMAKDIIELVDYLGWTSERELHVMGVSMGGMIAQELVSPSSTHPIKHNSANAMVTRPTKSQPESVL